MINTRIELDPDITTWEHVAQQATLNFSTGTCEGLDKSEVAPFADCTGPNNKGDTNIVMIGSVPGKRACRAPVMGDGKPNTKKWKRQARGRGSHIEGNGSEALADISN